MKEGKHMVEFSLHFTPMTVRLVSMPKQKKISNIYIFNFCRRICLKYKINALKKNSLITFKKEKQAMTSAYLLVGGLF